MSDDSRARKKREKFKRQDTPAHTETTPLNIVKRFTTPKSLSICGNSNYTPPSSNFHAFQCDDRTKSQTRHPLGDVAKHKKTQNQTSLQNLTTSPQISVNTPKLETTPR